MGDLLKRLKLWFGWCPRLDKRPAGAKGFYIPETYQGKISLGGGVPRGDIIYEERAPYSISIILLLSGLLLSFLLITALSLIGAISRESLPIFLFVTIVLAFIFWSFFNMRFRITTRGVEAVMPPFTFRVPYKDIKDVRVMQRIPWYVGWGLRIWGRRLAYVSMHKPAVVIESRRGIFSTLVLTARDPEKFAEMVKERMKWG